VGAEKMAKNSTKITRRIFNSIITFLGFGSLIPQSETVAIAQEEKDELEIYILPEDLRYPYSPKVREVLFNHMKSGKTRFQIREEIMKRCKVIKVPLR
jgi:NADH:ubiquinone oxidoreductase subunit D